MYDNDSKGISYTGGFFMLIAFAVGGLFMASAISIPIWQSFTGKGFATMKEGMSDPANLNAMRILQSITAIVGFLLPTIATAIVLHRRPFKLMGFSPRGIRINQIGLVILIVGASLAVSTALSSVTNEIPLSSGLKLRFDNMEAEYNKQVSAIIRLKTSTDYVLALVIMAFLPALCEEALFRGGLQNFLSRGTSSPLVAIMVVSLLFSLAHFSFYGFLSRFFLGIILGAIYHYSGKLWLSILAHFLNNALAITMLYIYTQQGKSLEQAMKEEAYSFWGILALPAVIALFVLFQKAGKPERSL
jgi:membrane protease YdiL (CAAX protease family)